MYTCIYIYIYWCARSHQTGPSNSQVLELRPYIWHTYKSCIIFISYVYMHVYIYTGLLDSTIYWFARSHQTGPSNSQVLELRPYIWHTYKSCIIFISYVYMHVYIYTGLLDPTIYWFARSHQNGPSNSRVLELRTYTWHMCDICNMYIILRIQSCMYI